MICQSCGVEAETRYVSFHEIQGYLVVYKTKTLQANLCKNCLRSYFWSMTSKTFCLGWWSTISFLVTPFLIVNNTVRYMLCLGQASVPDDAVRPDFDEEAWKRIKPYWLDLATRLNDGEKLEVVAPLIAEKAGVSPGQVVLCVACISLMDEDRNA